MTDPPPWYLYETLANVAHLDALLEGPYRDLDTLSGGMPVADIGAADGDLAFTLEDQAGWSFDIVDTARSNMNGLDGARRLKEALASDAAIYDIDLDAQFHLPRESYGLVMFLGILYHLRNPFYALQELAQHTRYCVMSTRIARYAGPERTDIAHLPVGYLVGPYELNNDPSNYWVFTPAGIERLVNRAGFALLNAIYVGDVEGSTPDSSEHDERVFMLLQGTR